MEIFLLIGGMVGAFFLSVALLKKADIIENMILAFIGYFCMYIIISGLLFWMDCFEIILAEILILGSEALSVFLVRKNIKVIGLRFHFERTLIPLVICMLSLPFVWDKFEVYGMGQDEGVYQTQAMAFIAGDTQLQHEIVSYNEVPQEEQKNYLELIQRKLVGFYLYDESLPMVDAEDRMGDASGFYHGVPTYPAILALWGSIAGLKNMAGIQTVFYICAIFFIYYILENLKVGKIYQAMGASIFAFSPIVVWVGKSTLTEMVLVCIVEMFIYLLTSDSRKNFILLSAFPLIAFSFFHITIYTIIPAIVLIYIILYVQIGKKEYLIANTMVLLGFVAGICMMAHVAATYSFVYNFLPLYHMTGFINQTNVLTAFVVCTIICIVLNGVLYICTRRKMFGLAEESRIYKYIKIIFRAVILIIIVLNMIVIGRHASQDGIYHALQFSTLIGYALFTGVVLLICSILGMLFYTDVLLKEKNAMFLGFMFVYFILIYAALLRSQINYYYYYGRYLVPYLPCVIVLGILMLRQIKRQTLRRGCCIASIFIAFLIGARYNIVLLEEKDDTRITWKILENCTDIFDDNDIVIVEQDMSSVLYLPLMHLTNAEVYLQYDLDKQLTHLAEKETDKDIYFITNEFYGMNQWENIYVDSYIKSEDDNRAKSGIPFPTAMKKEKCRLYIYQYHPEQYKYRMADEELLINGFYAREGEARWSNGNGNIYCYLQPAEYEVCIQQGSNLPIEIIENGKYSIELYFNGKLVDEYTLTAENRQEEIIFHVPATYVRQGRNELTIKTPTWSPAELGKSDTRRLGISIKNIEFKL